MVVGDNLWCGAKLASTSTSFQISLTLSYYLWLLVFLVLCVFVFVLDGFTTPPSLTWARLLIDGLVSNPAQGNQGHNFW